ncbi:cytochrome P450 [Penicillium angulare]|uniref:Cytochrome P450 n=1 Tax=Penicillium angulare TaxID=116970 RepID=A0A9W9GBU1_9EURO|nr:cytochrome P450 [Penicillium angulare]
MLSDDFSLSIQVLDCITLFRILVSTSLLFSIYVLINEIICYNQQVPGFATPPILPLIGNLHHLQTNAAEQYRKWAKELGAVYQVRLGNLPVIVINTAAAAKVILAHNSQATASRPELYTYHKLVSTTAGTTIGTSPYNDSLIRRRKGAASALNRPAVETYIPHLDLETKAFIRELLDYGHAGKNRINPVPLVQRLSLSMAFTINWGTRITNATDELFSEISHVENEISRFRSTTDNFQDYIPLLRFLPLSILKHRKATEYRQRRDVYLTKLNNDLEQRIKERTHSPCIQANVMLDNEAKLNKVELTSISLTMLSAGFETASAVMSWGICLLAMRGDIQERAFYEIRKVYGEKEVLCDAYDDQKSKYIVGLVREFLRYFTVLRLSLPRSTNKEFLYEGKKVPIGTTIFLNAWACNMDPTLWSNPDEFQPERWLEHPNNPLFTFGIGYRMCAGSLLAYRELYLAFLRLISAFEIRTDGYIETDPSRGVADLTTLVSMPKEYEVRFIPRDERLLREELGR